LLGCGGSRYSGISLLALRRGNVFLWHFSSGNLREIFEHLMVRGDRCRVKWGRYFSGPLALHEATGDNGLGVLLFYFGGSSFLSISAQPELRERDLVGLLAATSPRIIFKGSSLESFFAWQGSTFLLPH